MNDPRDELYQRLQQEERRARRRLLLRLAMWTLLGSALIVVAWRY